MRLKGVWIGLVIFGAIVLLACGLPSDLGLNPETPGATDVAASPTNSPAITQTPTNDETSGGGVSATATPMVVPATDDSAYPGPELPTQPLTGDDPYPGPGDATAALPPTAVGPYPGPGDETPTPVVIATATTASGGDAYPGPEDGGVAPTLADPYPGPGDGGQATPSPTPVSVVTQTPTSTGSSSQDATPSPTLASTLTPTSVSAATATPSSNTPTPTASLAATETPLATPTPTPLPSPTPTATKPPPPPWERSDLRATDPESVILNSGRVQLVWFFAFWDGSSQAMASMVHGVEDGYVDRMNFIYLDIDDPANDEFKDVLGYRFTPHFFLLDRNGQILKQWQGYVSADELQGAIEAALQ